MIEPVIAIGRDQINTLQLHDSEVSRRHVEIRTEADGFAVVDLQSSNGTFVNNQKIERQLLRSGDRLLDSWIFSGDGRCVDAVWVAGRKVVSDGRHATRDAIAARFAATMRRVLA